MKIHWDSKKNKTLAFCKIVLGEVNIVSVVSAN